MKFYIWFFQFNRIGKWYNMVKHVIKLFSLHIMIIIYIFSQFKSQIISILFLSRYVSKKHVVEYVGKTFDLYLINHALHATFRCLYFSRVSNIHCVYYKTEIFFCHIFCLLVCYWPHLWLWPILKIIIKDEKKSHNCFETKF